MNRLLIGAIGALVFTTPSFAQKAIYTGGPAGAYHTQFCPPLTPALADAYGDKADQKDMLEAIAKVKDEALLPKESRIAAIIKGAKRISGVALDEMAAAVAKAKEAAGR